MRTKQFICAFVCIAGTAALGLGCVAHAQAGGYAEADAPVVFTEPPTLVEVDTDVWVVRDYDYPVYYVGGSYWVFRDNVWWHSAAYDRGWARAEVSGVPAVIVHRDHHAYVHYHGSPTARTRPGPREHLASEHEPHGPPGHDEAPGIGNQRRAEEGAPDHAQHEEHKEERKVDRDEHKEERKADKKEDKKEEKKEEKRENHKEEKKGGPKKK